MFQNSIALMSGFPHMCAVAAVCIWKLQLFTLRSRSCNCRIKMQDKSCVLSARLSWSPQYMLSTGKQMCVRVLNLKIKTADLCIQFCMSSSSSFFVPQTPLVSSCRPLWTPPWVIGVSAVTLSTLHCSAPPPWAPVRVSFTRPSAPSARPSTACPHPSPSSAHPWDTLPWAAARPPTAWPSDRAWVRRYDITVLKSICFSNEQIHLELMWALHFHSVHFLLSEEVDRYVFSVYFNWAYRTWMFMLNWLNWHKLNLMSSGNWISILKRVCLCTSCSNAWLNLCSFHFINQTVQWWIEKIGLNEIFWHASMRHDHVLVHRTFILICSGARDRLHMIF